MNTIVSIVRCFPWSAPFRHLSIRDEKNEELLYVEEPSDLDADSAKALGEAVARSAFVLEVLAFHEVDDEHELRQWHVRTRQGERRFQTKLDEWPVPLPAGSGYLIQDLSGDLYVVRDPKELDAKSLALFGPYID
jgi:hypothetical protein